MSRLHKPTEKTKNPTRWMMALLMLASFSTQAQVFTGGGISAHFFGALYVEGSATIGYQYEKLRVGTSPLVSFTKYNALPTQYSFGNRLFAQYTVFQNLFIEAGATALNVPIFSDINLNNKRTWIWGLPIGAGYNQPLGDRAFFQTRILYDVLHGTNSPYQNPLITAGVIYRL